MPAILDGGRVRKELDRLHLTQLEFADRFHLREASVSRAIRGHSLGAITIFRIALGLQVLAARRRK